MRAVDTQLKEIEMQGIFSRDNTPMVFVLVLIVWSWISVLSVVLAGA